MLINILPLGLICNNREILYNVISTISQFLTIDNINELEREIDYLSDKPTDKIDNKFNGFNAEGIFSLLIIIIQYWVNEYIQYDE